MLNLTRKSGEGIVILGFINLDFIVDKRRSRVDVRIDAPIACAVNRTEVGLADDPISAKASLQHLYALDELLKEVQAKLKERIRVSEEQEFS